MNSDGAIRWHEQDRVQRGLLCLLLLLSPVGVPAFGSLLLLANQCRGGFDTEMRCEPWVPLVSYITSVMDIVWLTMLFGVGIIWIIAAGLLPFGALWYLYHGTRDYLRDSH